VPIKKQPNSLCASESVYVKPTVTQANHRTASKHMPIAEVQRIE